MDKNLLAVILVAVVASSAFLLTEKQSTKLSPFEQWKANYTVTWTVG